jgi:diguanylate cyclase (GGDEF)-like protein
MDKSMGILVVDDDSSLRGVISEVLRDDGHDVTETASPIEALEILASDAYPLVITDIVMDGMTGIELLKRIKEVHSDTEIIIMTSHASLSTAIQAIQLGAYDYVIKNFEDLVSISDVVNRVAEKVSLKVENRRLIHELDRKQEELDITHEAHQRLTDKDALTGLYNATHFREALTAEITRSALHDGTFSLLLVQVDAFQDYRTLNGERAAETLLCQLAEIITKRLRGSDLVCRYDDERFALLLPETPGDGAGHFRRSLQQRIKETSLPGAEPTSNGRITVHMGITTYQDDGSDSAALLDHAEAALGR